MAWALLAAGLCTLIPGTGFPAILKALGVAGAFCLYASFNLVAFCMIFLFVPETKQGTLEELDYVFAVPTRTFIKYQFGTWLPWLMKRHVLLSSSVELEPLYHFDRVERTVSGESDTTDPQVQDDLREDRKDERETVTT